MKAASIRRIASITLVLVAELAQTAVIRAQEVVIQVAGPWSYVTDPDDSTSVLLVAPEFADHEFLIRTGSDILATPSGADEILDDGTYKASFNATQCPSVSHPSASLYEVPKVAPQQISNIKTGTSGKRFAISLPKPCWYETVDSALAWLELDRQSSTESEFATWMVLHYQVSASTPPATLSGTNANGQLVNQPISFGIRSTAAPALSVVLYNNSNSTEDYSCDDHSAYYFDYSVRKFWSQPVPDYLFPELLNDGSTGTHGQTHQYDSDCNYTPATHPMHDATMTRGSLRESIGTIRKEIDAGEKRGLEDAKSRVANLQSQLRPRARHPMLSQVNDELKGAEAVIDNELGTVRAYHSPLGSGLLNLTEYMFVTGRVDCHAPQIDINDTVR
jgi:hypothetical protein